MLPFSVKNWRILLFFIVVLGFFLRVYDLDGKSLWVDEIYTLKVARGGLFSDIDGPFNSSPLHGLFMQFWINIFGDSEFALRFPSVIFGTLSILMIFFFAKTLYGESVGLISSFLFCLSIFNIDFANQARGYTLFVLVTITSFYCLFNILHSRRNHMVWIWGLFAGLCIWSHPHGIFAIFAQILIVGVHLRKNALQFLLRQYYLGVLLILYGLLLLPRSDRMFIGTEWVTNHANLTELVHVFEAFTSISWSYLLLEYPLINLGYRYFIHVFWTLLLIWSLIVFWRGLKQSTTGISHIFSAHIFIVTWLFSMILLPFVVSIIKPVFFYRFIIAATPAFYILLGKGISSINLKVLKIFVLTFILFSSLSSTYIYYSFVEYEDWRSAAEYVDSIVRPKDKVVISRCFWLDNFNYYSKKTESSQKPCILDFWQISTSNIWGNRYGHPDKVIILWQSYDSLFPIYYPPKGYDLEETKDFPFIRVQVFVKS